VGGSITYQCVPLAIYSVYCCYVAGLLNLFKSKVASPLPHEPVSVAVRFTYVLVDSAGNNTWTQEPPDFDFLQGESLGVAEFGKLPFGSILDPVRQVPSPAEFHSLWVPDMWS
jgi:Rab3 GTPase-activating protein catalytic subunit